MKAELIAVGTEMLRFGRRDTNGDWLTRRFEASGVEVLARSVIEDDPSAIAGQLTCALARADWIVVTGGLGPTDDDRTRDGIARALESPLERDPEQIERLRGWFESRGRPFEALQGSQADRPRGAEWVDNPIGTAPGFIAKAAGRSVVVLPGVPAEMKAMFSEKIQPLLDGTSAACLTSRSLRVGGRSESWVEQKVRDLYDSPGVDVTILSGRDGIELHLRARGTTPEEADQRVESVRSQMLERLGSDVYGSGGTSLSGVVGEALLRSNKTLATAESCTAGMLAAAITDAPGSSEWFSGGWVVYSNDLKIGLAGIPEPLLASEGAVSEPVARGLAETVRLRCAADVGVGITGIAGPGGGSDEKPVGLIHLAVADAEGTVHRKRLMVGDRELVRRRTVTFALDCIRRRLRGEFE